MEPHITEPMTMLTDYVLSAFCIVWAVLLLRRAHGRERGSTLRWSVAFLVAAGAALAGGTAHGFKLYLGPVHHGALWKVTLYSIGASAVLMLLAGISSARHPTTGDLLRRRSGHRWLEWGLLLSFAGVLIQRSGWGLHEHFNHNDIYHLVQVAGLYCFYRGARTLHAPEGDPTA